MMSINVVPQFLTLKALKLRGDPSSARQEEEGIPPPLARKRRGFTDPQYAAVILHISIKRSVNESP